MKKLAIFGTPINPVAAVEQLCGSSFCISFFYRHKLASQLNQLIRLTGENGMLLIDNGAFSFWKNNSTNPVSTYWDAYELWAYDILRRCPQAVAIAPDSIDADVGENAALLDDFRCGLIPFERIIAHSTPFGHLFHRHPAGDSTGIRPPVPRPFGRGSRSEATQVGHCYSAGTLGVNVRAWRLRIDSPLRVIR